VQVATATTSPSTDDQPFRLLLVRSRPGELPWLATSIAKAIAPAEIVQVIGFANAIWRLGNEPFDSVLLDVEVRDPAAMAYFREQIADVGHVPVLDLREGVGMEEPMPERAATSAPPSRSPAAQQEQGKSTRRGLRVPWQRRARRQSQPAAEPEAVPAG
jgi:hypothetical protein